MRVLFDDSLPQLVEAIVRTVGPGAFANGVVLRDVTGQLAFFSGVPLDDVAKRQLTEALRDALGSYARTDRLLAVPSDPGATVTLQDSSASDTRVGEHVVRVVDRRIAGADWLRQPAPAALPPRRFVFASLKGGVGRSTALCVAAAHLASRGMRVLALDLDLEAPGLGALLLDDGTRPALGVLDALVENGLEPLNEAFLRDMIGPSSLGRGGKIDVVPAFGTRSLTHPQDILAKLARAYAEDLRPDGRVATILDQVRELVDQLAGLERYDAIFVDARAGLHETTASAVLGLGAEVLFFGLDERQTFQGYAALLGHLRRFVPPRGSPPEWVERLSMIHAKAPSDAASREDFATRWRELVLESWRAPQPVALPISPGSAKPEWQDNLSDEEVLPLDWPILRPLEILHDGRYLGFDPLTRRDLSEEALYRTTFGSLVKFIDAAILSGGAK